MNILSETKTQLTGQRCISIFLFSLFFLGVLASLPSYAEVNLLREQVKFEPSGDTLNVQLPFQHQGTGQVVDTLKVSLLATPDYQPLAQVRKKMVLLNGRHVEEVALPLSMGAPALNETVLRIDLGPRIWLHHFEQAPSGLEMQVIGQDRWLAGSEAALRVIVTQSQDGRPAPDALVKAHIRQQSSDEALTWQARTDDGGVAVLSGALPESWRGEGSLAITAAHQQKEISVETALEFDSATRMFLTADKPVYQPGQLMHIRCLVTRAVDNTPAAAREVTLEVFDGRGNKVFKHIEPTSEFGIVSTDFQLADEVNQGEYQLKAILGEESTAKSVQVFDYVLPKFAIQIESEEDFYQPNDVIEGSLTAKYFFGKPLENAQVAIIGNAFDIGFNEFDRFETTTDSEGKAEFRIELPERMVGQPLFDGGTQVQLDVRVTDSANHEEQKYHAVHVASEPLQIEAIPESGSLIAGVPNEIYLIASRPDGSAAQPTVTVRSQALAQPVQASFNESGVAAIVVQPTAEKPLALHFEARIDGKTISLQQELSPGSDTQSLLLRPSQAVYRVGNTLTAEVLAPAGAHPRVFVDVVKNRQTVLTRTLDVENGRAQLQLPLTPNLAGTLHLNAYRVREDGNMIRDTRRVIVMRGDDLRIQITPNQERYLPGEPIELAITVLGEDDQPVQAALGMQVVDESVYSLSEKQPGLMKVFFALEKELLEPKVEVHGWQLPEIVPVSLTPRRDEQTTAKALLARIDNPESLRIQSDTLQKRRQQAQEDLHTLQERLSELRIPLPREPQRIDEFLLQQDQPIDGLPLLDPWGRPYYLLAQESNLWLASAGQEGQLGDRSDILHPAFAHGFLLTNADDGLQYRISYGEEGLSRFQTFDNDRNRLDESEWREAFKTIKAQSPEEQTYFARPLPAIEKRARLGRDRLMLRQRNLAMEAAPAPAGNAQQQLGAVRDQAPQQAVTSNTRGNQAQAGFGMGMEGTGGPGVQNYSEQARPDQTQAHFFWSANQPDAQSMPVGQDQAAPLPSPADLQAEAENQVMEGGAGPMIIGDEESLRQAASEYLGQEIGSLDPGAADALLQRLQQEIAAAPSSATATSDQPDDRAVRVRRYFPETLFYTPELITDARGQANLQLPPADAITTWRLSTMANAKSGALGDATAALPVFKPFFIDLNLPTHLTQDDEVTLPVSVYNYIDEPQTVEVELEPASWFELLEGGYSQEVTVDAHEVTAVTYRIRAEKLGEQPITVFAWGDQEADAMGRDIEVRPNGEAKHINHTGRLDQSEITTSVNFPASRIENADRLFVKIYPGLFSQVVEGLDAILRMPHGCFEQTSSTTYPNLLALNYMRETDRITPAIEMKATQYINLGYQRLLTFEIDGGGFSVFGNPPANRVLSAYGLLQFSDMSEVYAVDPAVIERTRRWLLGQRRPDGTWQPDEQYAHAEMWQSIQDNPLLVTAYIAYALAKADAHDSLDATRQYLLDHADQAQDAYTLSILSNALLQLAPDSSVTRDCIDRLVEMARPDGERLYWHADASMSFARGRHAEVEATAWAALALIESGAYPAELGKALQWIIAQKDPQGTWGTTHGTVMALKALLGSLGAQTEQVDATVAIEVNGEPAQTVRITPQTSDVFRQFELTPRLDGEDNQVRLVQTSESGETADSLLYQVVGRYYTPWPEQPSGESPFEISVEYDRSTLQTNDWVTCKVSAQNQRNARTEMVMIDVGIPPGFRVEAAELDDYVEEGRIAKYTIMSRQLLIYLESMQAHERIELEIPMRATLPLIANAPESRVYEYYNPEIEATANPQSLTVE